MRYINKIIDRSINRDAVIDSEEFINCNFIVKDSETFEVCKYTFEELENQKDYKEILGVYQKKYIRYFVAWSDIQVAFSNLIEYVDNEHSIKEFINIDSGWHVDFTHVVTPIVHIILDGFHKKKTYEENCKHIRKQCNELAIMQNGVNAYEKDYKDFTDFYLGSDIMCRVQKNCILQDTKSDIVYIDNNGNIYVNGVDGLGHYEIKDLANFNRDIAKILLSNEKL